MCYLKNNIDWKGSTMKKRILNTLWIFAKIDLLCYVMYFLSMLLLTLIFYHDVPAGQRDFTPIYWSMQGIFFFAYHLIYTRQINDKKIDMSKDEFSIKLAGGFVGEPDIDCLASLVLRVRYSSH